MIFGYKIDMQHVKMNISNQIKSHGVLFVGWNWNHCLLWY